MWIQSDYFLLLSTKLCCARSVRASLTSKHIWCMGQIGEDFQSKWGRCMYYIYILSNVTAPVMIWVYQWVSCVVQSTSTCTVDTHVENFWLEIKSTNLGQKWLTLIGISVQNSAKLIIVNFLQVNFNRLIWDVWLTMIGFHTNFKSSQLKSFFKSIFKSLFFDTGFY